MLSLSPSHIYTSNTPSPKIKGLEVIPLPNILSPLCWSMAHLSFSCSVPLASRQHTPSHTYKPPFAQAGSVSQWGLKEAGCSPSLVCLCCCSFSTRCVCAFQGPTSPPTWTASRLSSRLRRVGGCAVVGAATTAVRRETSPRSTVRCHSNSSQKTRASDSVSVDSRPSDCH